MLEYASAFVLMLALVAGGVVLWSVVRSHPPRPRNAVGRTVIVALLVVPLAMVGTWKGSKARTWQSFGRLVARVSTDERVVALTFDDGPTPVYVDEVLATLRQEQVPVTFFVIGNELERNPELGRRIVAAGHELGTHTYSHRTMMGVSPAQVRDEIERTDGLIRAAGYAGPILFRPPYCKKLLILPYYLASSGRTTITMDVEPESYLDVARSAEGITQHVLGKARPGSIILLHPWYASREETRKALPGVIQGLKAQGYRFVTVSELLAGR
jgi:peptidoglycan-N-acetylglucosamine deacetylase